VWNFSSRKILFSAVVHSAISSIYHGYAKPILYAATVGCIKVYNVAESRTSSYEITSKDAMQSNEEYVVLFSLFLIL
jgi:hypothetical protein